MLLSKLFLQWPSKPIKREGAPPDKVIPVATPPTQIEELPYVGLGVLKVLGGHPHLCVSPATDFVYSAQKHVPEGLIPFRGIPTARYVTQSWEDVARRGEGLGEGAACPLAVLGDSPGHVPRFSDIDPSLG